MKGATINKEMEMGKMFYRIDENGNARIFENDGSIVTRIDDPDANVVYPVGSNCSARYEHPEGITLTIEDAQKLGIEVE
jgi:hypothetical protein